MPKPSHRILYNQDCTNLFMVTKEPITPEHVDRMVDEVADGGADVFLANPQSQRCCYPSRVWQTFWDGYTQGDVAFLGVPDVDGNGHARRIHLLNQMKRLAGQCDYLERTLSRCRKRGIVPGVSVRMNDIHDGNHLESHMHTDFYKNNPQYRLPGVPASPAHCPFDYEHREVREYFLLLIRELAEKYDTELVELDFTRSAEYFRRDGRMEEHCRTLTGFIGEVRKLFDATGRKIDLIVRIASTPAKAKALGLDVKMLAENGLIDGVTPSQYLQSAWEMPIKRFRRLVGEEVAIYPACDAIRAVEGYPGEFISEDREMLRGFAAGYLALGADGINIFNFFCAREWGDPAKQPDFDAFHEMQDLQSLRRLPRRHLVTAPARVANAFECDLPHQTPTVLAHGQSRGFKILACDGTPQLKAELLVAVEGTDDCKDIWAYLNDTPLGSAEEMMPISDTPSCTALFYVPNNAVQDGWNEVVVRAENSTVTIHGLEICFSEEIS
ncbi:MAG: hypothetical protein ABFR33_07445 [Verrucomicrobiota bacterium]